jgi:hypothetical protein
MTDNEGIKCTGGHTLQYQNGQEFTMDMTVLQTASMSDADIKLEAGIQAISDLLGDAEDDTECVEWECCGECVANAGFSTAPNFEKGFFDLHREVVDGVEQATVQVILTAGNDFDILVVCDCEEDEC